MIHSHLNTIADSLPAASTAGPPYLTDHCGCGGTGVILVEGPCDAAPLEAPCPCLETTVTRPPLEVGRPRWSTR